MSLVSIPQWWLIRCVSSMAQKLLTHGSFLVESFLLELIMQSDGVEVCERPGLCTTLSHVVFTDSESLIGDVVCYAQNTAFDASRMFADPDDGASALAPCHAAFTGSERVIGDALRIPENTVFDASRILLFWDTELKLLRMTRDIVRLWSLSPSRTPVEFGLESISCFPRVSWTFQWT